MNSDVLKVFIGYDPVESVAWHTMAHSIFARSSQPVAIVPVNLRNLEKIYARSPDERQSNEFSYSRFLVPYLTDYSGYAAYFDCDMLMRCDIAELFALAAADPAKAAHVVQHDYEPKDDIKYLGKRQYAYPRKNWSSVVVWNCAHPANAGLSLDFVNSATPAELHRFSWLQDTEIGALDLRWNWIVGEYENPPADVRTVHWTIGGPYFTEYRDADFAEEWFAEKARMENCAQRSGK